MLFLWMKAMHLISLIAWFGGLFYLPRLYVYYAENPDPGVRKTLMTMQIKLWKVIMVPASFLTAFFGFILLTMTWDFTLIRLWFQLKALFLLILYGYHFYLRSILKGFEMGMAPKTGRFYRILNEVPTVILIVIVVLVVVKPWSR